MAKQPDEVARTIIVYRTNDYDKFKDLSGNREVYSPHKNALANAMWEYGNWLIDDPIQVNERFEIFDGQHSFQAAKQLGEPVYYTIIDNGTAERARRKNSNRRNWNWYDFASSYAKEGNENYQQFLDLAKQFKTTFSILTLYTTGRRDVKNGRNDPHSFLNFFNQGKLVIKDYEQSEKLLQQYRQLAQVCGHRSREFGMAVYSLMTETPNYNQEVMRRKLYTQRARLNNCYIEPDFLYTLQDIYNS